MAKLTSSAYSFDIFTEIAKNIFFAPLWWYSVGLIRLTRRLSIFISNREKSLALFVWIKNIFTPMYGQRDFQGIIISVFIRIFQIIFRLIVITLYLSVVIAIFWLWALAPIFIIYQIIWQIFL